jgi:arylsulfatase A-like enzyme
MTKPSDDTSPRWPTPLLSVALGLIIGLLTGLVEGVFIQRLGAGFTAFAVVFYALCGAILALLAFLFLNLFARLAFTDSSRPRLFSQRGLPYLVASLIVLLVLLVESGNQLNRALKGSIRSVTGLAADALLLVGCVLVTILVYRALIALPSALSSGGRRLTRFLLLSSLAVIVICISYLAVQSGKEASQVERPNIILISLDALRPDHLSCYGYDLETSPNLDRVASEGVLFEWAYAQSPGSTGSHASMLTGLYPLTHGAYNNSFVLQDTVTTLAEIYKKEGYATAAFIDNFFISARFGFDQGFDCFVDQGMAQVLESAPVSVMRRGLVFVQVIQRILTGPGEPNEYSITDALSWISSNHNRNFFLFLHIMDAHEPYAPPDRLKRIFYREPLSSYSELIDDDADLRRRAKNLSAGEVEQLIALYDGEIAFLDEKIGRLFDQLDELGIDDNTVVVITADHGEMLYEKDKVLGHGFLYHLCLRVPLIFWYPEVLPEGKRITEVVEMIDLTKTLFDLTGVEYDPAWGPEQAESMWPELIQGNRSSDGLAYSFEGVTEVEGYALTTRQWELRWHGNNPRELYHIATDPGESMDLAHHHPELVDELSRKLIAMVSQTREETLVLKSEKRDLNDFDKETEERLRSLGYIE